jgi:tetratricopeptide (TPR) repeat protein
LEKAFTGASDARRFLELNALALQPDKVRAAAPQITTSLNANPSYVPALFASGILQEQANNSQGARDFYARVLRTFPSFVPAHKRLAMLLLSSPSDASAAHEHALKAREKLPDDPEVARTLGILSFRRQEYARAAQLLKESTRKQTADAEGFYYLGAAQFHLKQKNDSRMTLQRAIALNTNAPFAVEAKRMIVELR